MNMQFSYETQVAYQGIVYCADVFIDVTNIIVVSPDHTSWDSEEDYFGTKELQWEIVLVELYDQDGECSGVLVDDEQIEELGLDHKLIEAWLWKELEAVRNADDWC